MLCNLAEKNHPRRKYRQRFPPFLLSPRLDRYYSDLILRSAMDISTLVYRVVICWFILQSWGQMESVGMIEALQFCSIH